ncbi:Cu,Zn superoxide dismutase-like protein [Trichodelitschia bisporula]|uniref:Superoxide dismutase 1 copper chaperone n=1 Tax=Trichodelitschia bisporula TaxID=703511 RepID=A0A6G1HQQ5_9PEZI|nr:Cu,Zn superoxide dismutase-like protein [Trichodelitschia bisporula]
MVALSDVETPTPSTIPPFQTTFAVHLSCEDCIKDVSSSLFKLSGIKSVNADLQSQLVAVEGTAAPSAVVAAIQSTGRDAILRGSGAPNSAAVCILETHSTSVKDPVRGLVRIVQVAPTLSIFDVGIRGVSPGTYFATIRESGDISAGPESTGKVWEAVQEAKGLRTPSRGILGTLEVGKDGVGSVFLDKPVRVWELVGRSIVVSKQRGQFDQEDPDTLVGVIARSAGVWENDKTVCSCTGKTVWEERKEQVDRGML